jgi:hypothetical protein
LKVSFRTLRIYDRHVRGSYNVWFSRISTDNLSRVADVGVIRIPSTKTDEKDTLEVWVPVNDVYPELGNNSYTNKDEIVDLINRNENFFVNVIANMSTPYELSFIYE